MKIAFMKKSISILVVIIFILCLPNNVSAQIIEPEIFSEYAIIMEANTGKVLFEQNAYDKAYPASTTKIVTALVALENSKLTEIVNPTRNVYNISRDSTRISLQPNELMTMEELLYGLMVRSGNDASIAIAEHVSGSVEAFTKLMTERAAQLGAKNSHFVNTHGLHHEQHFTTAYDLAIITRAALQIPKFKELAGTLTYTMRPTNMHEEERTWRARNRLLNERDDFYYEYATGGKTGFTSPAGNCLVSFANKDGMELIAVVLKGTRPIYFEDSISLFEYGFDKYVKQTYISEGNILVTKNVLESDDETVDLITDREVTLVLEKTEAHKVKQEIIIEEEITAPVIKGQILGKIIYTFEDTQIRVNLIASRDVEEKSILDITEPDDNEPADTPLWVWLLIMAIPAYIALRFIITIVVFLVNLSARRRKRRRIF